MNARASAFAAMLGLAACVTTGADDAQRLRDATLADCDVLDPATGASGYPRRVRHTPTGLEFVLIEPRPFTMGSKAHRVPEHHIDLLQPYYLATTEVTVAQWRAFAHATGYRTTAELEGDGGWREYVADGGPDHPVQGVTFDDARSFCAHYDLTLPGEAQWEYACRAGTDRDRFWGEDPVRGAAFGTFDADGPGPVAAHRPNPFGLYDMLGNVAEWAMLGFAYSRDPTIRNWEVDAVHRGGSYLDGPAEVGAAERVYCDPGLDLGFVGFRPAFLALLP